MGGGIAPEEVCMIIYSIPCILSWEDPVMLQEQLEIVAGKEMSGLL